MYRRDFGIVLLSVFAIYWTLQNEGTYQLKKAFYYSFEPAHGYNVLAAKYGLPRPLVADLNGDGNKEVLLVSSDLQLHVLSPQPSSRFFNGFALATVCAKQPLSVSHVLLGGRTPIALAAGYIDPPGSDLGHARRKMIIVVVTSGWVVVALDHNLNVLWETSVNGRFPHHATVREVCIYITHHKVKEKDRGMVVIGGSVIIGDLAGRGAGVDDYENDEIALEMREEEEEARRARGAASGKGGQDIDGVQSSLSSDFSFHAFEGGSGSERWHNAGTDFRHDLEALQQDTIPQHNYRLDAAALEARRFGEVACRTYRESVLHSMPHFWSSLSDTRFKPAHFAKHQESRGAAKERLAGGGTSSGLKVAPPGFKQHAGVDEQSGLSSMLGGVLQGASAGGAARGKQQVAPGGLPPVQVASSHTRPPNVLVAHGHQGLDVVNLYTGQPVCKLMLRANALHADIDGDGVLDEIIAVPDAVHMHAGHHMHDYMRPCNVYAYSGYPAQTATFNGTICKAHIMGIGATRGFGINRGTASQVELAPPIAVPQPGPSGHYRPIATQHSMLVFLNSRGELTAYTAHGARRWQVQTAAAWINYDSDSPEDRVTPTLRPLPLHQHAMPTAILVAGGHSAAVYNLKGDVIDMVELPGSPTLPLVVADFTGDGLNDVLVVTRDTLYGFQMIKHLGAGLPYATMVAALLIAVVVVFVTQQGPASRQRIRSTDRVD